MKGKYRTPDGKATIDWSLEEKENGAEFSASGSYDGGGGQCLEGIAKAYPTDAKVQEIVKVWRLYHLNGMNAGTREQAAAIDKAKAEGNPDDWRLNHYDKAVAALKAAGLYEVPLEETEKNYKATGGFVKTRNIKRKCHYKTSLGNRGTYTEEIPATTYKYGERWLFWTIPAETLEQIKGWQEWEQAEGSQADANAAAFLKEYGIKFRATLSDSKPAHWKPAGHHYRVTLSRGVSLNSFFTVPLNPAGHHYRVTLSRGCKRMTFDFWGSRQIGAGSVLPCIASDLHTPQYFEDFCDEYGHERDSIKAKQTHTRCVRFAERLRGFFSDEEQEALCELS